MFALPGLGRFSILAQGLRGRCNLVLLRPMSGTLRRLHAPRCGATSHIFGAAGPCSLWCAIGQRRLPVMARCLLIMT